MENSLQKEKKAKKFLSQKTHATRHSTTTMKLPLLFLVLTFVFSTSESRLLRKRAFKNGNRVGSTGTPIDCTTPPAYPPTPTTFITTDEALPQQPKFVASSVAEIDGLAATCKIGQKMILKSQVFPNANPAIADYVRSVRFVRSLNQLTHSLTRIQETDPCGTWNAQTPEVKAAIYKNSFDVRTMTNDAFSAIVSTAGSFKPSTTYVFEIDSRAPNNINFGIPSGAPISGHSSFLTPAEYAEAKAGTVSVYYAGGFHTDADGKITHFDNNSGHFRPTAPPAQSIGCHFGFPAFAEFTPKAAL